LRFKKLKAYEHNLRVEVVKRYDRGDRQKEISQALNIPYSTIKNWIVRYREEGMSGLALKYGCCGSKGKVSEGIKQEAIRMKEDHDSWGGVYIRMKLLTKYPGTYIPTARQLQRYFVQAGLVELKTKPPSMGSKEWAKRPLYRVQVDAKEQLKTRDGHWCSYLTFTDEHSGATLEALVFPP